MKTTAVRTRVLRRRGEIVPPHFCTNPMDLLPLPESSMQTFTFSWLASGGNFHRRWPCGFGQRRPQPPMAEYFPVVDVEVGNELFWYIFSGEPRAKDGSIDLDDNIPGLGLTVNEDGLQQFGIIE